MAIYVSAGANMLVSIRPAKSIVTASGEPVQTVTRLKAQFQRGNPGDWAIPQIMERLPFGALPDGVRPASRMGVFDTNEAQATLGWTDEERKTVEDFLDENQGPEMGFIRVEQPRLPAPWPAIENLRPHGRRTQQVSAEKLIEAADTFGVGLDTVAAYVEQEGWPKDVAALLREHAAREAAVPEPDEELVEA